MVVAPKVVRQLCDLPLVLLHLIFQFLITYPRWLGLTADPTVIPPKEKWVMKTEKWQPLEPQIWVRFVFTNREAYFRALRTFDKGLQKYLSERAKWVARYTGEGGECTIMHRMLACAHYRISAGLWGSCNLMNTYFEREMDAYFDTIDNVFLEVSKVTWQI